MDFLESEALREAYAVAPANTVILDTLEVSYSGEPSIFITNNYAGFEAVLENSQTASFQPIPFKVNIPNKAKNEIPVMKVVISNPGQIVSNYLRTAKSLKKTVAVKFRPFLAKNLNSGSPTITNQLPTPMTFYVGPVNYSIGQVEVQCLFPNIANKRFPNEAYTIRLFPGLRGW